MGGAGDVNARLARTIEMNVHCFQHAAFEGLGAIGTWVEERGHRATYTRFSEGAELPPVGTVDFLVVMGGPMNVYEYRSHPWLRAEKQFIERFLERGAPVLGVCLGAQLIADVLGAKVYQNAEKEIGWFPVRWKAGPETSRLIGKDTCGTMAFHWHGDTFDLPMGATWLAETDACAHQAFSFGRHVAALQFHLETGREEAAAMLEHCAADVTGGRFVQSAAQMVSPPDSLAGARLVLWNLLNGLAVSSERAVRVAQGNGSPKRVRRLAGISRKRARTG